MKLVDVAHLLKVVNDTAPFIYDLLRQILDRVPAVKAEPVRHGRWIAVPITKGIGPCPYFNGDVGDNRHNCVGAPFSCPCKRSSIWGKSNYHCSECGLEVGYSEKSKTNYCPNCGAKMDKDGR